MPTPYLNRELSWVEFNQRVLNEALRDDLPLLERVKFLAITASNLDEFFQVRIGGLMAMRRSGMKSPDPSGLTPARNLAALRQRILQMTADQYALFNHTLVPALKTPASGCFNPQICQSNKPHRSPPPSRTSSIRCSRRWPSIPASRRRWFRRSRSSSPAACSIPRRKSPATP